MVYSIFLRFPFGAGLIRGVYVTVLVTISLTSRMLDRLVFGDLISKYLPLLIPSQSYGDLALRALRALKGERTAEDAVKGALKGESEPENAGDGGIRRRPSQEVERAEDGWGNEVGGTVVIGDLRVSQLQEQSLCSLDPVEGAEVGVLLPDDLSPAVTGLAIFMRKSVYAVGGVIGVLRSSCLMKST